MASVTCLMKRELICKFGARSRSEVLENRHFVEKFRLVSGTCVTIAASGNAALRGNHAEQLVSFARRSGGRLDMFYPVDKGQVIFDLLDDKPVSPTWEFK